MARVRYGFLAMVGLFISGLTLGGCAPSATVPSETVTSETVPSETVASEKVTSADTASAEATAPEKAPGESVERLTQGSTPQPVPLAVTVVENLEHPWGMAWLPNGTMLVSERAGRLRVIQDGVLAPAPVSGLPEVLNQGQGGLMDVSVHPQFAENRWVYFTYADGTRAANRTQVARARFDGSALSDWQVIFEVNRTKEGTQHFGSRMVWLADNTLLISIGDGGNPPVALEGELIRNQAQNLASHLGKLIRINDDGSTPTDNPFAGTANADPHIWSYGHRNIQGVAIDPVTDQVWATEHGARGGDELNRVVAGKNYGWPIVTHSREYAGGEISSVRSRPDMVDPLIVWTPAIAPSGLTVYRSDRVPQWQGDLFAGGLVSQAVQHIQLDDAGAVLSQTPIDIGQRVRDVAQGPDGLIYVLTDEPNGRLVRLEPG